MFFAAIVSSEKDRPSRPPGGAPVQVCVRATPRREKARTSERLAERAVTAKLTLRRDRPAVSLRQWKLNGSAPKKWPLGGGGAWTEETIRRASAACLGLPDAAML